MNKQDLKKKLDAYRELLDKLDEVSSSLSDAEAAWGRSHKIEPGDTDWTDELIFGVVGALAELQENARERAEELENELDALGG